ncbi:CpaF family protein [Myxococcota bacterium]|nr:CpaF family protein [Myxococcota bacterium]
MTSNAPTVTVLRVVDPKNVPTTYPIDPGRQNLSVGSPQGGCNVKLGGRGVAPYHADLKFIGPKVLVRVEAGQLVLVDGRAVAGLVEIAPGAPIKIGDFTLYVERFSQELPSAATVSPAAAAAAMALGGDAEDPNRKYRRDVHRKLIDELDLRRHDITKADQGELRLQVEAILHQIVRRPETQLPSGLKAAQFVKEMADECLGLGPIEDLLRDRDVSEIMVVDAEHIYIEVRGRLVRVPQSFSSDDALETVIQRIVRSVGRRVDRSQPMVDARLKDGSRVNAVLPPLALRGPCLTIRRFPHNPLQMSDVLGLGSLDERMARFLQRAVQSRQNILISGGTGSGKTTLLNILSSYIDPAERIITVEDAAELKLLQSHVVSLETRPANLEGKGEYTIRDLVRNALRMRPDRIIVGECRGPEALDMLQAMNTGHAGSMTTLHANAPTEALSRLETLVLFADQGLSSRAIREQIVHSIGLIVQQSRLQGGVRRITHISEIVGIDRQGAFVVEDIFRFVKTGVDKDGVLQGRFQLTGHLPSFLTDLITLGLVKDGEYL